MSALSHIAALHLPYIFGKIHPANTAPDLFRKKILSQGILKPLISRGVIDEGPLPTPRQRALIIYKGHPLLA